MPSAAPWSRGWHEQAVVVTTVTTLLPAFAEETGRSFLAFKEEPRDHWYPGGWIGLAFRPAPPGRGADGLSRMVGWAVHRLRLPVGTWTARLEAETGGGVAWATGRTGPGRRLSSLERTDRALPRLPSYHGGRGRRLSARKAFHSWFGRSPVTRLRPRPEDAGDWEWLADAVESGEVEAGLHGATHRTRRVGFHSEFDGMPLPQARAVIGEAWDALEPEGRRPVAFVPPFDRFPRHCGRRYRTRAASSASDRRACSTSRPYPASDSATAAPSSSHSRRSMVGRATFWRRWNGGDGWSARGRSSRSRCIGPGSSKTTSRRSPHWRGVSLLAGIVALAHCAAGTRRASRLTKRAPRVARDQS